MIKRKIFSVLLSIFFSNILFAQHSFEKIITNPEDQVINTVIEDGLGNFIMVGRSYSIETGDPLGYIVKIDSMGNLLQEKIIQQNDTSYCMLYNIHCFNEHFYILGLKEIDYVSNKLWYLKLNTDLEIENEVVLNIPDNRILSYTNSILDSDTNLVITGYTVRTDTNQAGNIYYNYDVFFYKLNLDGDSLISKFFTTSKAIDLSYDIIETMDSANYYAFVRGFTDIYGTAGQRLTLSKNLDSLDIDSIPLGIHSYYSPIYINETDILLCGDGSYFQSEAYSLNVISINEEAELINYNHYEIGDDMCDYSAIQNGVSKNSDNIYIGGTSNMSYTNPYFSSFDSWYHLVKLNPDTSPIWEYWYGGDAYYVLYSILATNDGGCLLVGNRYDDVTQYMERDIYIVKVNADGLITWEQEITIDNQTTTVYPNPGTNLLNLKTNNEVLDFELININGQTIIKQIVDNNYQTINTELLKSGIYFYRLINKQNNTIETGKWIKK